MLGNTLAASFIWGINTLFLLDAGLTNLEAFAANAFFTAGMVLFEMPTGIVADTWGAARVVPARHADARRLDAPLLAAVGVGGAVLGVGGRVDAARARVHVLLRRGRGMARRCAALRGVRRQPRDGVRARADGGRRRRCSAAPCSAASIAQVTNLGVPFLMRVGVLGGHVRRRRARLMRDLGFTPDRSARPLRRGETVLPRRSSTACEPAGALDDARGAVRVRRRHLRVLRAAAVPARALGRPGRVLRSPASPRRSSPARRSSGGYARARDPRSCSGKRTTALILATVVSAGVLAALGLTDSLLGRARCSWPVWALVFAAEMPIRQAYLNDMIPSKQRATVLSFDSLMGSRAAASSSSPCSAARPTSTATRPRS